MTSMDDGPRFADFLGVPTFYTTDVIREDAGDGNVRVWNCIKRSGVLIPQCEIIVPASKLLVLGQASTAFALDLCQKQTFLYAGIRH